MNKSNTLSVWLVGNGVVKMNRSINEEFIINIRRIINESEKEHANLNIHSGDLISCANAFRKKVGFDELHGKTKDILDSIDNFSKSNMQSHTVLNKIVEVLEGRFRDGIQLMMTSAKLNDIKMGAAQDRIFKSDFELLSENARKHIINTHGTDEQMITFEELGVMEIAMEDSRLSRVDLDMLVSITDKKIKENHKRIKSERERIKSHELMEVWFRKSFQYSTKVAYLCFYSFSIRFIIH